MPESRQVRWQQDRSFVLWLLPRLQGTILWCVVLYKMWLRTLINITTPSPAFQILLLSSPVLMMHKQISILLLMIFVLATSTFPTPVLSVPNVRTLKQLKWNEVFLHPPHEREQSGLFVNFPNLYRHPTMGRLDSVIDYALLSWHSHFTVIVTYNYFTTIRSSDDVVLLLQLQCIDLLASRWNVPDEYEWASIAYFGADG